MPDSQSSPCQRMKAGNCAPARLAVGELRAEVGERISTLEAHQNDIKDDIHEIKQTQEQIFSKINALTNALSTARGAGWATIKIGAFIAGGVAVFAALWHIVKSLGQGH